MERYALIHECFLLLIESGPGDQPCGSSKSQRESGACPVVTETIKGTLFPDLNVSS
jgi:hypothetical protein